MTGQKVAARPDGTMAGNSAVTELARSVDWSTWKPGSTAAAEKVADGGMRQLLGNSDTISRDIGENMTDRIGNVIARGLEAGSSPWAIRNEISDYLGDPARAFVIANTETARGMIASQSDQYQAQGFATFDWIAHDGACDECDEAESNNPHEWSDDQPPAHPNCACGIVGSGDVTMPEEGATDGGSDLTPPSDAPEIDKPDTSGSVPEPVAAGPTLGASEPANSRFSFPTMADAVDWFTSKNIQIDGDAMDAAKIRPSHLEEVAGALKDADLKTPGIIDELTHVEVASNGSRWLAAIASMDERNNLLFKARHGEDYGKRLLITKKLARVYNSPKQTEELFSMNKEFFVANNIRDIYTHEFGHVAQHVAEATSSNFAGDGIIARAMREAGFLDAQGIKVDLNGNRVGNEFIAKYISEYAGENALEFHSEVQVLFNHPDRFAALPEEIQNMLIKFQQVANELAGMDLVKFGNVTKSDGEPKPDIIADDFGLPSSFFDDVETLG